MTCYERFPTSHHDFTLSYRGGTVHTILKYGPSWVFSATKWGAMFAAPHYSHSWWT